jgi:hypothetical protein
MVSGKHRGILKGAISIGFGLVMEEYFNWVGYWIYD